MQLSAQELLRYYPTICSLSPFGNIVASDTTMVPMYSMKKSFSSFVLLFHCVSFSLYLSILFPAVSTFAELVVCLVVCAPLCHRSSASLFLSLSLCASCSICFFLFLVLCVSFVFCVIMPVSLTLSLSLSVSLFVCV